MGEARKAEIKSLQAQINTLTKRLKELENEEYNEYWTSQLVKKISFVEVS